MASVEFTLFLACERQPSGPEQIPMQHEAEHQAKHDSYVSWTEKGIRYGPAETYARRWGLGGCLCWFAKDF